MSKRFSIVIPTYNRVGFLRETLASVYAQTLPAHEVIVVNDGSTDGTLELVEELSKGYQNLLLIDQDNSERGAARNNGWANAVGDYVVFFDSDDRMLPNYLQKLEEAITISNGENIFAGKILFNENGRIKSHRDQLNLSGEYNYKLFLKGNPLACHFAVPNSKTLKRFSEDRSLAAMEDWIFLIENSFARSVQVLDFDAVEMSVHSGRSMNAHQELVNKRLRATNLLLEEIQLNSKEAQALKAYSFQFALIHSVDARDFRRAIRYAIKTIIHGLFSAVLIYSLLRFVVGDSAAKKLATLLSRINSN